MSLDKLQDGQNGIITAINVDKELKDRLFSFGICRSKKIKKLQTSLRHSTILVELDRSCVILRAQEAMAIEVNEINENN